MVKTISMDIEEYQQEVNGHVQTGICQTLNQIAQFIKSKKTPAEFFGKECLDLAEQKSHLVLQLLTELGHGDKVMELIKRQAPAPVPVVEGVAPEPVKAEEQPTPETAVA